MGLITFLKRFDTKPTRKKKGNSMNLDDFCNCLFAGPSWVTDIVLNSTLKPGKSIFPVYFHQKHGAGNQCYFFTIESPATTLNNLKKHPLK